MASEWYCDRLGEQSGPLTFEALSQRISDGKLEAEDVVWSEELGEWKKVRDVPHLRESLPAHSVHSARAVLPVEAIPAGGYPGTLGYSQPQLGNFIQFSPRAMDLLDKTAPWVRIIAILGFLGSALMILAGIVIVFGALVSGGGSRTGTNAIMGVVYIGFACLYAVPSMHLWNFAKRIKELVHMRREDLLESALEAQKSFWKFTGILTVVVIGIYLVIALFAVIGLVFFRR